MMTRWVACGVLFYLLASLPFVALAANKKFTLVIDAGHGGHDAGAVGAVTKEKAINLNVALAFGQLVEQNCPDVNVIYTRKTDVFVPLHTRADIANRNKADLFISIHTNSLPKGHTARGLETYTLGMHRVADNLDVARRENSVILIEKDYKERYEGFDPRSSESYIIFEFMQDHNMAQSVELAKFVQRRTCAAAARQNKGVKQAGFLVLRETSMPSCLIELGFISTSDEEQFLHSKAGVSQLGQGIYQAFLDYKRKYAPGGAVPYRADSKQDVTLSSVMPRDQQEQAAEEKLQKKKKVKQTSVQQDTVKVETPAPEVVDIAPIFKVQIVTSSAKLKETSPHLKGQTDVDYYQESGLYKYTVGSSSNYNDIAQLRKSLLDKFPQAFIIAFKNGEKTDVRQAIQEYQQNKKK